MSYGARGYGGRGDYGAGSYRGGFNIGKFLGGAVRAVGRVASALPIPGAGLVGMVASGIAGGGGPGRAPIQMAPGQAVVPTPGVTGMVQRFLPGGASGYSAAACITKDGRPRRVRKDGKCWKRPSMNVANPRAAGRAIRRIRGARKLLQRIESSLPKSRSRKSSWGGSKKCGCR